MRLATWFMLPVLLMLAGTAVAQASGRPAEASRTIDSQSNTDGSTSRPSNLAEALGISFPNASHSTLLLTRGAKQYLIDVTARTVREVPLPAGASNSMTGTGQQAASTLFAENCTTCHGPNGNGIAARGTPNFHDPAIQHSLSDRQISDAIHNGRAGGRMPAWSGKLSDSQISDLTSYIRTLSPGTVADQGASSSNAPSEPTVYTPGDDVLVSLPSGRPVERHGVYVNFAHRFAFDPAFTGSGRGEVLFGLDGFALPSFGFTYGLTEKLSVSIYRSPSAIGRPIQLMAGYHVLDEHKGNPLNMTVRFSVEGQDNFRQSYTENFEAILSRSITSRAQVYLVPTLSVNDRPLAPGGFRSQQIPKLPGTNAFSLGMGAAFDVRPTVALLAEVIPTLVNGRDLGIHRPAYSFGIQKKIWRHAFTLGLTTSPGTTVSQRSGTRAQFLGDPSADTPGGLFLGFDLTRQIH